MRIPISTGEASACLTMCHRRTESNLPVYIVAEMISRPPYGWLIQRGIKTLGVRMERAQSNAFALAQWLKKQPIVSDVIYPGLAEHPGHEIMKRQATGFGAMLTFRTVNKEAALAILAKVRLIRYAESLGGVETLMIYPTTQTHADVPKEIRERNGITESTLRVSVGIEDIEDLLAELETVFREVEQEQAKDAE